MSINNVNGSGHSGGHAFPFENGTGLCGNKGMTLRDYFAALIAGGMAKNFWAVNNAAESARMAYQMADAMLVERTK